MIGLGLGLALGLALAWPRGLRVIPTRWLAQRSRRSVRLGARAARGLAFAIPTLAITRWPVAAVAAWIGGQALDASVARRRAEAGRRARKLAVAEWTETLRDLTLAGYGVEAALQRAGRLAGPALRPLMQEAEARLEHAGSVVALERLGETLDDRDADLVVLHLSRATEGRAHNLAEVLDILRRGLQQTVAMEEEIDAARAKPRREVTWATAIFGFVALVLVTVGRDGLAAYYDSAVGQAVLAGVIAWFAAGLASMVSLTRPVLPERSFGAPRASPPRRHDRLLARTAVVAAAVAAGVVVVRGGAAFLGWASRSGVVGGAVVGGLAAIAALAFKDGLRPPPPSLRRALARLESPTESVRSADTAERVVRRAGDALGIPARVAARRSVELRLVGESLEQHLARRFIGCAAGVLAVPVIAVVAATVGLPFPISVPVWISPALGLAGFLYPGRTLARRAEERRVSLSYALVSFLYAAGAAMKSGLGREQALEEAAGAGVGWAFDELRATQYEAWAHSDDVAVHLDRLGVELGDDNLRTIAASLAAGAESGAPIADALISKAESIHTSMLNQTRTRAVKATQDMDAAVVALVMMPIVAFMGIPAVAQGMGL